MDPNTKKQARSTVFYIESRQTTNTDEKPVSGSGVLVKLRHQGQDDNSVERRYLLTCAHVIFDFNTNSWRDNILCWAPNSGYTRINLLKTWPETKAGENIWQARIRLTPARPDMDFRELTKNPGLDWALLEVEDEKFQNYSPVIDWVELEEGKFAYAVGYPNGSESFIENVVENYATEPLLWQRGTTVANGMLALDHGTTGPGMSGGGVFDVEGNLIGIHRCQDHLGLFKGVVDINFIHTELSGHGFAKVCALPIKKDKQQIAAPMIVHALPPAPRFIGRKNELRQLSRFWDVTSGGVCALVGIGGAGKTAIAAEFLSHVMAQNTSCKIFAWSFYEDQDTNSCIRELYYYLGGQEELPESGSAALAVLMRMLSSSSQRLFLILDGTERVQRERTDIRGIFGEFEDRTLRHVIARLGIGVEGINCLITTRFPLSDLNVHTARNYVRIDVDNMDRDDANRLLASEHETTSRDVIENVIDEFGSHALTLDFLRVYINTFEDGDLSRAHALPTPNVESEILQERRLARVLIAYESSLKKEELQVLSHLCIFRTGVNAETMADIFGSSNESPNNPIGTLDANEIKRILLRLASMHLILDESQSQTFTVHPAVRDHFYRRLVGGEKIHRLVSSRLSDIVETYDKGMGKLLNQVVVLAKKEEYAIHEFETQSSFYVAKLGGLSPHKTYSSKGRLRKAISKEGIVFLERKTDPESFAAHSKVTDFETALEFALNVSQSLSPPIEFYDSAEECVGEATRLIQGVEKLVPEFGGRSASGEQADKIASQIPETLRSGFLRFHFDYYPLPNKETVKQFLFEKSLDDRLDWSKRHEYQSQLKNYLAEYRQILTSDDRAIFISLLDALNADTPHELSEVASALKSRPGIGTPYHKGTLDALEEVIFHSIRSGNTELAKDIYFSRMGGPWQLGHAMGEYGRGLRILEFFPEIIDFDGWFRYRRGLGDLPTDAELAAAPVTIFSAHARLSSHFLKGHLSRASKESPTAAFLQGSPVAYATLSSDAAARFQVMLARDQAPSESFSDPSNHFAIQLAKADWERNQGNIEVAQKMLERAMTWIIETGSQEHFCAAYLVEARLHRSRKQFQSCENILRQGLEIARLCGFGLFHIELACELGEVILDQVDVATDKDSKIREARAAALMARNGVLDDGSPANDANLELREFCPGSQLVIVGAKNPVCQYAIGIRKSEKILQACD